MSGPSKGVVAAQDDMSGAWWLRSFLRYLRMSGTGRGFGRETLAGDREGRPYSGGAGRQGAALATLACPGQSIITCGGCSMPRRERAAPVAEPKSKVEKARLLRLAGAWKDLDAETLKRDIYRWRHEPPPSAPVKL